MAAAHGRECSRIRADAERLADGAGGPWPEELRAISAAAAANEPVQCSVCDAVQTDPLGAWLDAVDGLFRRRVVAFRRSATRLIAGAHAERQRAIREAAEADALRASIGYVTRDPDGHPVGYGETMHEAARDARWSAAIPALLRRFRQPLPCMKRRARRWRETTKMPSSNEFRSVLAEHRALSAGDRREAMPRAGGYRRRVYVAPGGGASYPPAFGWTARPRHRYPAGSLCAPRGTRTAHRAPAVATGATEYEAEAEARRFHARQGGPFATGHLPRGL